jgi:DNA circularisation protein N-terminus
MSPLLSTQKRTLRFRPTLGVRRMSGVTASMPDSGPSQIHPYRAFNLAHNPSSTSPDERHPAIRIPSPALGPWAANLQPASWRGVPFVVAVDTYCGGRRIALHEYPNEVIPLQSRIESAAEESELDEVFDSERHLLYVACTRARDQVAITGIAPGSEFLADLIEDDKA